MLHFFDTFDDLLDAVRDALCKQPRRVVLRGTLAPWSNRAVIEMASSLDVPTVSDGRDLPEGSTGGEGALPILDPATSSADDLVVVTDGKGRALATILMDYLDQPSAEILCLKTSWHYTNRPLLFTSVPKSGTHLALALLLQLGYRVFHDPRQDLNLRRGVANELLRDRQLGEHVVRLFSSSSPELAGGTIYPIAEPSFHMPFTRLFEVLSGMGIRQTRLVELPIVFSYRNPLGVLVSEAWAYRDSERHILGHYFSTYENTEGICHDLVRGIALTSLIERLAEYPAWLRMANVIPVSYEELVGAEGGGDAEVQRRLIWSMQLKLQIPGDPKHHASAIYDTSSPTFRRGRLDAFKDELSDHRVFVGGYPELGRLCEDFGYHIDDRSAPPWPLAAGDHRVKWPATGSTPAIVARLGETVVWNMGKQFAALPKAFQTICRHCIPSAALGSVRLSTTDFAAIRSAVRSPETQDRHGSFRHLGCFWHLGVVSDGRRYYAFPRENAVSSQGLPCDGQILVREEATSLFSALYEYMLSLSQAAPRVVFETKDSNLVLFGGSAFLIPRQLGHVEIGPDEQPDHPAALRFAAGDFGRYLLEREAGIYLQRWIEALREPADAGAVVDPVGEGPHLRLAGEASDIVAYVEGIACRTGVLAG